MKELTKQESSRYLEIVKLGNMDAMFDLGIEISETRIVKIIEDTKHLGDPEPHTDERYHNDSVEEILEAINNK